MARKQKKRQLDSSVYYSFESIDTRNAILNFVIGSRGNGKTYGAKEKAIRNYLRYGNEFIYLRRYKEELATFSTFFNDIADQFPDYQFRVIGRTAQIRRRCDGDEFPWKTIGYGMVLSVAQQLKGSSYPKVGSIIFDEFIIEKGVIRYLTNEVETFLNFYNTIDRYRDTVKVYFLANAISIANPYFVYFKIDVADRIRTYHNNYIAVEFCDSANYIKEVEKTRFGQFVRSVDPEYASYVMDNAFNDSTTTFIDKKHPKFIPVMNIKNRLGTYSVWIHPDNMANIHVQSTLIKNSDYNLTCQLESIDETWTHVEWNSKLLARLRTSYRYGMMTFDSPQTRVIFTDTMKR